MTQKSPAQIAIAIAMAMANSPLAPAMQDAVAAEKEAGKIAPGAADIGVHQALDAEFGLQFGDGRKAPDWVHDVVDWIWDLIF